MGQQKEDGSAVSGTEPPTTSPSGAVPFCKGSTAQSSEGDCLSVFRHFKTEGGAMAEMKLSWLKRLLLSMLLPLITELFNEVIEGRESRRLAEQLGVPDEKVDAVLQAVAQLLIYKLEQAIGRV
jgi:hypothetical protein